MISIQGGTFLTENCPPFVSWWHTCSKQYFFACLHARWMCVVAVYMAFVHHGGKLALDNKWSSLGISDRDRFSTWQHISDDVAFTLAKSLSLCSLLTLLAAAWFFMLDRVQLQTSLVSVMVYSIGNLIKLKFKSNNIYFSVS